MVLSMDGESEPETFLERSAQWPAFSPDGKWIAYASDESGAGQFDVHVRPFRAASLPIGFPQTAVGLRSGRRVGSGCITERIRPTS